MVWTGSWTSGLCTWEPNKIDVSCFFFLFLFFFRLSPHVSRSTFPNKFRRRPRYPCRHQGPSASGLRKGRLPIRHPEELRRADPRQRADVQSRDRQQVQVSHSRHGGASERVRREQPQQGRFVVRRTRKNVFVNLSVFVCNICRSASDFIIGTVHKAKGLEFNTVMVCDDFVKLPPAGEPLCYYYRPQFSESSLPGPVELQ